MKNSKVWAKWVKNGRKMVKKREFLPFFGIRRFGQLGRIFGRIISVETGRIFGRIFGIRSYTNSIPLEMAKS